MDEVVGRVDTVQSLVQRQRVKHITLDDLGGRCYTGQEFFGFTGQTPESRRFRFEQCQQATADIPGGSGEQNDDIVFFLGVHRFRSFSRGNESCGDGTTSGSWPTLIFPACNLGIIPFVHTIQITFLFDLGELFGQVSIVGFA